MNISEGSFFSSSSKSFKIQLGEVTFYIYSWQINRQRVFTEQNSVNGENLVTNCFERFGRLSLEGIWVTDAAPCPLILKLDEYIHNNTSFTFNLQQLHFSDCRLIKYMAEEKSGEPYINVKLELLSTSFPEEAENIGDTEE